MARVGGRSARLAQPRGLLCRLVGSAASGAELGPARPVRRVHGARAALSSARGATLAARQALWAEPQLQRGRGAPTRGCRAAGGLKPQPRRAARTGRRGPPPRRPLCWDSAGLRAPRDLTLLPPLARPLFGAGCNTTTLLPSRGPAWTPKMVTLLCPCKWPRPKAAVPQCWGVGVGVPAPLSHQTRRMPAMYPSGAVGAPSGQEGSQGREWAP